VLIGLISKENKLIDLWKVIDSENNYQYRSCGPGMPGFHFCSLIALKYAVQVIRGGTLVKYLRSYLFLDREMKAAI
jgi:hypothetical protein